MYDVQTSKVESREAVLGPAVGRRIPPSPTPPWSTYKIPTLEHQVVHVNRCFGGLFQATFVLDNMSPNTNVLMDCTIGFSSVCGEYFVQHNAKAPYVRSQQQWMRPLVRLWRSPPHRRRPSITGRHCAVLLDNKCVYEVCQLAA